MDSNIPKEMCHMKVKVGDVTYALVYGSKENRALVDSLGEEVLMIPRLCIQMQPFQLRLMHKEDGWTSPAWPFLTISTKATAVVVPFDSDGQGVFADLILVFPKGYMCTAVLPDWSMKVDIMEADGVTVESRAYRDCDHFKMGNLNIVVLLNLIDYILKQSCPFIITLVSK